MELHSIPMVLCHSYNPILQFLDWQYVLFRLSLMLHQQARSISLLMTVSIAKLRILFDFFRSNQSLRVFIRSLVTFGKDLGEIQLTKKES